MKKDKHTKYIVILIIFAFIVTLSTLFGERGLLKLYHLSKERNAITQQNISLMEANQDLKKIIKLLKSEEIDKSEHVVVISTAHGLKFTDFKVDYHQEKFDFPARFANKPIELPPDVGAVKKALEDALKKKEITDA